MTGKCNTCGNAIPKTSHFQHYCTETCWQQDKTLRDQAIQQESKLHKIFKRKKGKLQEPPKMKGSEAPEELPPLPDIQEEEDAEEDYEEETIHTSDGEVEDCDPSPPTTQQSSEENRPHPQPTNSKGTKGVLTTGILWKEATAEAIKLGCTPSQFLLSHTVLQNINNTQILGIIAETLQQILKEQRGETNDDETQTIFDQ